MPVPSLITDLSTTVASNSPSGSDNVFPDLDNYLRALSGFVASIRDNSGNGWVSPYLPLTYSAGTANGVVYLNGSKVVTTGSALVFDGTNVSTTGTASATKLIPTGGSATGNGMYLPAANTLGFSTNGTQAMTLDESGNLLVGTTSSTLGRLEVVGGTGIRVNEDAAGTKVIQVRSAFAGGDPAINVSTNHALAFNTNNTERARITSGGYFKAQGTSTYINSAGDYHEFVATLATGAMLRAENKNNTSGNSVLATYLGSNCSNTSSYHYSAITGGTDKLYIYGNGDVVNSNNSYGALSDIKLKENITDATPKLDDLMQVRVVNYNLKTQPDQKHIGVIAQELEQVFPGMVEESPDRDADGELTGETTKSVKYSVFVPMLIKALQEQQALITALTARVAALESN